MEAAYDRGIVQELESQEQPVRGEGITAPYPSTDHQYSEHEYWTWYQQTMGTTDTTYNDYPQYPSGAAEVESTEPMTQQQIEQVKKTLFSPYRRGTVQG